MHLPAPRYGISTALKAARTTMLLIPAAAMAQVSPAWVTRIPAGSSLSAGLQGLAVAPGGVAFVTGISGSSGNTDVVTAALAPDGSLLWSHTFDGVAAWHDQSRGIALDRPVGPLGSVSNRRPSVYVTGNTPGPGSYANVLLLKYDAASGALVRTIQWSSAPGTSEHGASVAVDAGGNVYVGGGTVGDGGDALLLKFNRSGAFQWSRTWDGPAAAPYSQDDARQVRLDPQGDLVVLIHGVMATLQPDYVVLKIAPATGAILWETAWGVGGGDYPREMEVDAAGDVYVTGQGLNVRAEYATIKLHGTTGGLVWQAYDAAGYRDAPAAMALDGAGGVYVTGSMDPDGDESNLNDNYFTVKRDAATGSLVWTHLYGSNCIYCYDVPADVLVDRAGNVVIAGRSSSAPYAGDMLMLVLDAATGLETSRASLDGQAGESVNPRFLRLDRAQDVLVGGQFYDTNTGAVDISVAKYPPF